MTIRLSYPGIIQWIFVGSSTFSIPSTRDSIHLYSKLIRGEPSYPLDAPRFTAEQWLSVLVVSIKYDMAEIHRSTVEKLKVTLPRLDPIQQILAARKYDCATLVDEPIQTLVARKQRLTLDEMTILPMEDLHTIVDGREGRVQCIACNWTNLECSNCGERL